MKTKEVPLNPEQDIELTFIPDFQTKPIVVTGAYDAVMPIANEIQALEAAPIPTERNRRAATAVIEAVQSPVRSLVGNLATRIQTDVTAALYDRRNGTHFLDALRDKRQTEKDLLMADKLGLLSVQPCAKHRHYLDEVRKIR